MTDTSNRQKDYKDYLRMKNKTYKAKEDFKPLYRQGDKFVIIKINDDKDLLPIEAKHLRTKQIYGFEKGEIE